MHNSMLSEIRNRPFKSTKIYAYKGTVLPETPAVDTDKR